MCTHSILHDIGKKVLKRERAPKYNSFLFYSLPFLSQILESVKCWLEFSGKKFSVTDWEFVLQSRSGSCPTGPCLKG